jgi:hypothetical protein
MPQYNIMEEEMTMKHFNMWQYSGKFPGATASAETILVRG